MQETTPRRSLTLLDHELQEDRLRSQVERSCPWYRASQTGCTEESDARTLTWPAGGPAGGDRNSEHGFTTAVAYTYLASHVAATTGAGCGVLPTLQSAVRQELAVPSYREQRRPIVLCLVVGFGTFFRELRGSE